MKIVVTAREVSDCTRYDAWERFCKITGVGHYAMADGMDPDEEFTLTYEQAAHIGLICDRVVD